MRLRNPPFLATGHRRVLAGIVAVLAACSTSPDFRDQLETDFTRTVGSDSSDSAAYYSTRTVAEATEVVNGYVQANETIADATTNGSFLQYRDAIVGVYDCARVADAPVTAMRSDVEAGCAGNTTGSVVYVDDYSRGRVRWGPYVGRRWGANGGLGPSFRGGGSGDGK